MQSKQDAAAAAWAAHATQASEKPKPKVALEEVETPTETPEEIQRRIQEEDDRIMMTRMGKGKAKAKRRINNDASDAWAAAFKADEQRQGERSLDSNEREAAQQNRSQCHAPRNAPSPPIIPHHQPVQRDTDRDWDPAPFRPPQAPQGQRVRVPQQEAYPSYARDDHGSYNQDVGKSAKVDALREQYRKFAVDRIMEQRRKCMAVVEDNEVFDWVYKLLSESQQTSVGALQRQIAFLQKNLNLSRDHIDSFLSLIEYERSV